MRGLLLVVASSATLLVLIGFLGQLHRGADSVSIARPLFGLICLLAVFIARSLLMKLILATTALVAFSTVAVFFLPQEPGGDIRVYSKNLRYWNTDIQAVATDIEASEVEVVMLQEVSPRNDAVLKLLMGEFPHQRRCRYSDWNDIALVSQYPFAGDPICSNLRAVLAVPIWVDNKRIWVVSAHIPWPWPQLSATAEKAAETILSDLDGPVVIGGDFNLVPWSGRVGRITSITNTRVAGPVRPTFYLRNIPLPIDLIMAPGGGSAETRPLLGSDHAGVVADLKLWLP